MRRITQTIAYVLGASLLMALGFGLAFALVPQLNGNIASASDNPQDFEIIGSDLLFEQERVFADIYQNVAPSVVSISIGARTNSELLPFATVSGGSGFIIDAQGHIVTNYHVVANADRIEVSLYDGTITEAQIVGEDPDSDISVIKINLSPDRIRPITFADSNNLRVGQTVLALGNPFNRDWTLTSGIISALNRSIVGLNQFSIGGVIQTDAAINPGNSGGPLVNLSGQVVGVNSQIVSEERQNSGVGFAVPSNLVNKIAQQLIANGFVDYSFIGIGNLPINLDTINLFNLPDNIRGVAVAEVIPNTPAERAGLSNPVGLNNPANRRVDVVTAINGVPIDSFEEMIGYLAINTVPGDTVTLTVYRDGQILQIPLTLMSRTEYSTQGQ